MQMKEYIEAIKLELTAGVLELEISDGIIEKTVNMAFKEVQRYIDVTDMITIPYAPCIDLSDSDGKGWFKRKVSSITKIYRTEGYMGDTSKGITDSAVDPMMAQMWMAFSNGGTMYNLNNYILNYTSFNTLLQMRNSTSTDLAFKEDSLNEKLYINTAFDAPENITIEYVPKFEDVSEVKSDYWEDIILRLSIALTKRILGRVRTRFTQSNALWQQDGQLMLEEGNRELSELREILRNNSTLFYPID